MKRHVSVLLTLAMLLSLISVPASAQETQVSTVKSSNRLNDYLTAVEYYEENEDGELVKQSRMVVRREYLDLLESDGGAMAQFNMAANVEGSALDPDNPTEQLIRFRNTSAAQVAAGATFSMSLKEDGSVWAWGGHDLGQCGDGYSSEELIQIVNVQNIKEIAAGHSHGMALDEDGFVWVWGSNEYGELGDGTTTSRATPAKVEGLPVIKSIWSSASVHTSIVIADDNTVWYWGDIGGSAKVLAPTQLETTAEMKKVVYTYGEYLDCFMGLDADGRIWS